MSTISPYVLGQLVNAFSIENKQMLDNDPRTSISLWSTTGPTNVSVGTINSNGNTASLNIDAMSMWGVIDSLLEFITKDTIINMQIKPINILVIPAGGTIPTTIEIIADGISAHQINALTDDKYRLIEMLHAARNIRVDLAINDTMKEALEYKFNSLNAIGNFIPAPIPTRAASIFDTSSLFGGPLPTSIPQEPMQYSNWADNTNNAFVPRDGSYSRAVPTATGGNQKLIYQPNNLYKGEHTAWGGRTKDTFRQQLFSMLPRIGEQFIRQGDSRDLIINCLNQLRSHTYAYALNGIVNKYYSPLMNNNDVCHAGEELINMVKTHLLAETQQFLSSKQSFNYETGDNPGNEEFMQQQYQRQADLAEQLSDENYKNSFSVSQMHDQTLHGGVKPVEQVMDKSILEAINHATAYAESAKHVKLEDLPLTANADVSVSDSMAEHLSKVEQFKFETRKNDMLRDANLDDVKSIFADIDPESLEEATRPKTKVDLSLIVKNNTTEVVCTLVELDSLNQHNGIESNFFISLEEFEKYVSEADTARICYVVNEEDQTICPYRYILRADDIFNGDWQRQDNELLSIITETCQEEEVPTKVVTDDEFDEMFQPGN